MALRLTTDEDEEGARDYVTGQPRRVRTLSFHAGYACGNSGACCTAGWPIPVEGVTLPVLQQAIDTRRVVPAGDGPHLSYPDARPAPIGAVLGRTSGGACVFFDRSQPDGCCRVHRHAGLPAMPIACRQFPRIARHDTRGTDVSLSHWCPTALARLDADSPVAIVHGPPAFPDAHALDGLDARDTWPPLLRHDCLWDLDAFDAFEAHAVDLLANSRAPLLSRVTALAAWAERLRTWTSADGALLALVVSTAPPVDCPRVQTGGWPLQAQGEMWDALIGAVPTDLRGQVPAGMRDAPVADATPLEVAAARDRVGRYLAARLFGSWVAYQGQGVRALVASTATALTAVVRGLAVEPGALLDARVGAAIRSADLVLVHLATPEVLATAYDAWERRGPVGAPLVTEASGAGVRAAWASGGEGAVPSGPAGAR